MFDLIHRSWLNFGLYSFVIYNIGVFAGWLIFRKVGFIDAD